MKPLFRSPGDDRGSLPMAMLVTTIGLVLSVALLPLIVRQVVATRGFADRSSALNGAQVGLDVVMARVRAASESTNSNVRGRLEDMPQPCEPITGDAGVDGTGEKLLYVVTIKYYGEEGNDLGCDPLAELPFSAGVESIGSSTSGDTRTLTAKYTFWNENDNIPGGAIKVSSPTDKPLCMDSGTVPPAAGAPLVMKRCNGSSTQLFGYTEELYLKLINSEAPANDDLGMCLHAGATHATNSALVFQKCPNPTNTTPTRVYQWSLDGNSRFHSTSAASAIENLCVYVKTGNTVGSPVVLNTCTSSATQNIWRSDASVGAGMAGDRTNQLVNFAQFSRCLDVTNQEPGSSYMIAWFCKQSPVGAVDWNQIWVHPMPVAPEKFKTGTIEVTKNGTKYCLKSPLRAGGYPTTMACGARTAPELQWTVFHDTGVYATSYRIEDSAKLCLQPSDLNATVKDVHTDGTSRIKVATCSKSELQKWNAPPKLNQLTPISGVEEK
ncbi:RICIN domain-containing protein [Actinoplanes aureus]|uniref:RICIN domain-containing protein n=1 Tax=Actinoplanes aureus TaxID=2792083 RepID=A0A931BZE2_9ACTN|nr:RICIN domain-containing protein [Actinoplanes aureus]MBG0560390.1 RICIN domain-containing protein [Actinoplanes aureus]